jgi:biotin-(acetyl-CoA carboxylase) ligase
MSVEPGLEGPTFPPLLTGVPLGARVDPFARAVAQAQGGEVEPGTVHYAETDRALRLAVTFAPETPLRHAMGVVLAVELGLADAIGALAPPEVAVHFTWPAGVKVNGAACGRIRAAASTTDPAAEPDWLVVGVELDVSPEPGTETGRTPDRTWLHAEGCADVTVPALISSFARHMLVWVHSFMADGLGPAHAAWRAKCDTLEQDITEPQAGFFAGLDEHGGMLLRTGSGTRIIPLTTMLEAP